jgi:hypothetical protein
MTGGRLRKPCPVWNNPIRPSWGAAIFQDRKTFAKETGAYPKGREKVNATVLVDNYAFVINGVFAQHGWAVFLETDQGNYLLDTGAGKIIVNNTRVLGVDLDSILAAGSF